jgi:predicted DNA-binding protein (MmcQ/YjbR family)
MPLVTGSDTASTGGRNEFLTIIGVIVLAVFIIVVACGVYFVYDAKYRRNIYERRLRKILRDYDRVVVESKEPLNIKPEDEVIEVLTITELGDVADRLSKPIFYHELVEGCCTLFAIKDKNVIYKYVFDVRENAADETNEEPVVLNDAQRDNLALAGAAVTADVAIDGVRENANEDEEAGGTMIEEYGDVFAAHDETNPVRFKISRACIAEYAMCSDGLLAGSGVFARSRESLPISLKNAAGRTYAMLFERNGETTMILRLSEDYENWLTEYHTQVRRARFPRVRNWYLVPIDGSFSDEQEIYRMLKHAMTYVDSQCASAVVHKKQQASA